MKKGLLFLVLFLSFSLFLTGCGKTEAEKNFDDYLDDLSDYDESDGGAEPNDDGLDDTNESAGVDDGDSDIEYDDADDQNSIELGLGEWPDDAPDSIVEFTDGEVVGKISNSYATTLTFDGVTEDEAEEYIAIYSGNSSEWQLVSSVSDDGLDIYSGMLDGIMLTIEYDYGTFSIIWEEF